MADRPEHVLEEGNRPGGGEVPCRRENRTVTACLATIPSRVKALQATMKSLAPQVDQFRVYLNGHIDVPVFLDEYENVEIARGDNSLGANAKTFWLGRLQGYLFTCDDDLLYPPDYVTRMRAAIDKYRCLIGASGNSQRIKGSIDSYLGNIVLHPLQGVVPEDTPADIIGTGTLGYHTDDVTLKHADFAYANMVDISLLRIAERDSLKRIVIQHPDKWITRSADDDGLNEKTIADDSAHTAAINKIYAPRVTVVLINYKRSGNTHKQIAALRQQSIGLKIVVWNNGPKPFCSEEVDWLINSSQNVHGHVLPMLYQMADTDFVCRMDDDLLPTDCDLLADVLSRMSDHADDCIVGAYGTILDPNTSYRFAEQYGLHAKVTAPKQVDLVKGRFMFFRRQTVRPIAIDRSHIHADMVLNFSLAKRRRLHHVIYPDLPERLQDLEEKYEDKSGAGYSQWKSHYPDRERISKEWLRACER